MFDVAAKPGISEVLTGRADLSEAAQRAPRTPCLRVVTTGGTASAGGLLQSQFLRDMLSVLRQQAEYIVIEAPSTASSADAQSLASLADAAIVVVELRRTSYAQLFDATDQLRRVGTPVLGSVVLARLSRPRRTGSSPDSVAPATRAPASRTSGSRKQRPAGAGANGRRADIPAPPTMVVRRIPTASTGAVDESTKAWHHDERAASEYAAAEHTAGEYATVEQPADEHVAAGHTAAGHAGGEREGHREPAHIGFVDGDDFDEGVAYGSGRSRRWTGHGQATGIMAALTEDGLDGSR
jgi:hypothetical protein